MANETHEGEVQCKTCKGKKWVPWDLRHAGRDPKDSNHTKVRCSPCKSGQDLTYYTGRMRGEVVPKTPAPGYNYPGWI